MRRIAVLLCLVTVSPMALADEYCNVRFDYCIDVPEQLQWMAEATNGDGRHFELTDAPDVSISVFGSYTPLVLGYSDSDYLNKIQNTYNANTVVTYESKNGNSYTVSGYNACGDIYYHVIKVQEGVAAELHLNYSRYEKENMNSVVKQMAKTFKLY